MTNVTGQISLKEGGAMARTGIGVMLAVLGLCGLVATTHGGYWEVQPYDYFPSPPEYDDSHSNSFGSAGALIARESPDPNDPPRLLFIYALAEKDPMYGGPGQIGIEGRADVSVTIKYIPEASDDVPPEGWVQVDWIGDVISPECMARAPETSYVRANEGARMEATGNAWNDEDDAWACGSWQEVELPADPETGSEKKTLFEHWLQLLLGYPPAWERNPEATAQFIYEAWNREDPEWASSSQAKDTQCTRLLDMERAGPGEPSSFTVAVVHSAAVSLAGNGDGVYASAHTEVRTSRLTLEFIPAVGG